MTEENYMQLITFHSKIGCCCFFLEKNRSIYIKTTEKIGHEELVKSRQMADHG